MAERDDRPEGWDVPHRPAVIAAIATPAVLLALLIAAGIFYDRDLRPGTTQPVKAQPAPGLETYIHDGANDPYRPKAIAPRDPAFAAVKRGLVADGLPGWTK